MITANIKDRFSNDVALTYSLKGCSLNLKITLISVPEYSFYLSKQPRPSYASFCKVVVDSNLQVRVVF